MELPRDIQLNVIRKMDIDTRRALNIYTKLNIPDNIKKLLNKIPKIITVNFNIDLIRSYVFLTNHYMCHLTSYCNGIEQNFYTMYCHHNIYIQETKHEIYSLLD
jgi:hypothetical protein